ncbi:MAG TPA: hypothetical protein VI122_07275, partial [Thermoleophilaceae bacterium]
MDVDTDRALIELQHFRGPAVMLGAAAVDPNDAITKSSDRAEVMTDEENGSALVGEFGHPCDATALELGVADGEDFVDDDDVGFEVGGDGEGEPQVHAGGVALEGGVEEALDA